MLAFSIPLPLSVGFLGLVVVDLELASLPLSVDFSVVVVTLALVIILVPRFGVAPVTISHTDPVL